MSIRPHLVLPVALVLLAAETPGQDLKGTVDSAISYLRDMQDPDGAFGSTETTALAVRALATSHRAYRPDDGPFMRKAIGLLNKALSNEPEG